MIARLYTDQKFFTANVLGDPVLNAYWERVQARPSYKQAHIMKVRAPHICKITFV